MSREKWYESNLGEMVGCAIIILAILLGIGGCNLLASKGFSLKEGKPLITMMGK